MRISRRDEKRVFVAVHLFAGARRDGDLESCLYECCTAAKIELLSLSIDLENDPQWDITLPDTFYRLYELAVEGLIDLGTAGPPCSTWSRLRFLPGGPRPLRFRSSPWGRPDLTRAERLRVNEANICMLHALTLLEAIIIRGGLGLLEHPEDPAVEPMPSVWATEEMELFLVRTGCRKHSIEQCAFDAPTKKPTGLASNIPGIPDQGPFCPGCRSHYFPRTVDEHGVFSSRKLSAYPRKMCEWLADLATKVFVSWLASGKGPTGWIMDGAPCRRITNWSSLATDDSGLSVTFLNESAARSEKAVISPYCAGFYLHVDDGLFAADSQEHSAGLMRTSADALEEKGFRVCDRQEYLTKTVGYSVQRKPAKLFFPLDKGAKLRSALRWVASCRRVQVDVIRSLIGVWIHGALLRRDLLSIPYHVFKFVEEFQGQVRPLWASVRAELLLMSNLICFMEAAVGRPAATTIFASDAQGAGDCSPSDCGGFGIVAKEIPHELLLQAWRGGFRPGLSVARLDGTMGAKWAPHKVARPSVPFTRLPAAVLGGHWEVVAKGRWHSRDHITLGEGRAHVRILQALAAVGAAHGHRILALEDNTAVAASMAKGRSPAEPLNFLCRRRAALCLASEITAAAPWVQTSVMPADEASRDRDDGPEVAGPAHRGSHPTGVAEALPGGPAPLRFVSH